jgi:hypothetical protein
MEKWAGAAGSSLADLMVCSEDTLLDPEETSAGDGLGFSGRTIDHACEAYRRVSGWCLAQGGGWLLVEMCIVDASILFFCN